MEVLVDEACERSLEERIAHVCGHLNVLHAELVDMVCEAAETGAWEVFGIKSLAQWVAWQTGLSPARARQIVTIAERRGELPVSFDAFAQGRVAIDQMVTVAAKVPAPFDAQAAELAQVCTVTQLGRAFNKHAFPEPVIDPASPVTPVAERDYVSYHADDHGRFRLTLACDALLGATISAAIDEARDALFTAGNTDVTLIDTIVEIAQRSLATIDSVSRADRYRVLVHLDTDGLFLHQGPRLPTALHDSLLCDGVLQPVWETSGTPINVGRNHRTVPERLRRLIEHRDQHCQHPTCTSTHHLDIHHIKHWQHGGTTDTNNLIALCQKHHQAHHHDEYNITGNPDIPSTLIFTTPDGKPIQKPAPNPTGHPPQPPPHHPYQHPTGETLNTHWLTYTAA